MSWRSWIARWARGATPWTTATRGLVLALVLPSCLALLTALGINSHYWADGLIWTVYMLAAASLASIFGLIFGVPRARTDFSAEASERYSSNSNLEQISDWLTKLLVGAGLVELTNIPGAIGRAGDFLGHLMRLPGAAAFSVIALVYGSGVGFATGYLWTRLRFRVLLESSDREAADASAKKIIVSSLRDASSTTEPESERAISRAADVALQTARTSGRDGRRAILWVDDHPENNASLVTALNAVGVQVELARSTDEGMAKLRNGNFGLVITDLGRTEHGVDREMAGLELIQAMREAQFTTPVFVYAGRRGILRSDELKEAGATLVTNRAAELYEAAVRALAPA
ncbi:MAG TPA: response regulator [Actinomycetes bacterium]|nr:response regulator [Actinomycetes bacterium]